MFTGIIEALGEVKNISSYGSGMKIDFSCPFLEELKIDQSIAHNGVCLTVSEINGSIYSVIAIEETLKRSNLGQLKPGDFVNLERCVKLGDRMDGHLVQGHVDTTAVCENIEPKDGSWIITFSHPESDNFLTVEKGSIAVNGISLTVFDVSAKSFSVAIIPYTYENTNLGQLKSGDAVNIEFDITGKYVKRIMNQ